MDKAQLHPFASIKEITPKVLRQIFNSLEDLCYLYKEGKLPEDEEVKAKELIISLGKWLNSNKKKIDRLGFTHPYLPSFFQQDKDLKKIDDVVASIITPVYQETLYNWLNHFKSSDCFYQLQGGHQDESSKDISDVADTVLQKAFKSVKTEKAAGYHTYIICGKASKDYKKGATGAYYKKKAGEALNKDMDALSPAGKLDGDITQGKKKYALFATSDLDVTTQDVFPTTQTHDEVIFVVNALFNQGYSPIQTEFNAKKARQHGSSFLNNMEGVEFNANEKGLFNVLPIMALLNNIRVPTPEGKTAITDFLKINPFVVGTDTYFLYKTFRDIREYEEPQRTEKLLSFAVGYLGEVTEKVSRIKIGFSLTEDTRLVLLNIEKTILGVVSNFNKSNLPGSKGLPDKETLEKLHKIIVNYKHTVGLMGSAGARASQFHGSILDLIDSKEDLVMVLQKNNKNISKSYMERPREKTELSAENTKNIESILEGYSFTAAQTRNILTLIQSRQVNSADVAFTSSKLGTATYEFFNRVRQEPDFKDLFSFVETNLDFNDKETRNEFGKFLGCYPGFKKTAFEPSENLLAEAWDKISEGQYENANKIRRLYSFLKKRKEVQPYELHDKFGAWYYYNLYNKEDVNSFWSRSENSQKSEHNNQLLQAMGLYDVDYKNKGKISFQKINESLKRFLSAPKPGPK